MTAIVITFRSEVYAIIVTTFLINFCLLASTGVLWLNPVLVRHTLVLSGYRILLVLLLLVSFYTCLLVLPIINQSESLHIKLLLVGITVICKNFFFASSAVSLFVNFELRLIPIFLIIMGWGYQTERMGASLAIFLYTALGSIPLLLLIIIHIYNRVTSLSIITDHGTNKGLRVLVYPIIAFLIKLPIVGVHIWLPKAHVEAPVVGSMFLAAVLLKLGGWGIILYQILLRPWHISAIILGVSAMGLIWVSVICCQTVDSKTLIAFSSVLHIRFVIFGRVIMGSTSKDCAVSVILSHGFSSSVAFFIVFCFYKTQNSRRLIIRKTLLSSSGLLNLIWLGTILALVGCPPSFNLWVEIICYIIFNFLLPGMAKPLFWGALLGGAYGFLLIGKIYWGSDLNFKSSLSVSQTELIEGLLIVILTIAISFSLAIISI